MQTSGIKIDIDKSENLLLDNSKKIEKIIKFAVGQAVTDIDKPKKKATDLTKKTDPKIKIIEHI
jgi:hypothetical protein